MGAGQRVVEREDLTQLPTTKARRQVFEWLRRADTPLFREMLTLIKDA